MNHKIKNLQKKESVKVVCKIRMSGNDICGDGNRDPKSPGLGFFVVELETINFHRCHRFQDHSKARTIGYLSFTYFVPGKLYRLWNYWIPKQIHKSSGNRLLFVYPWICFWICIRLGLTEFSVLTFFLFRFLLYLKNLDAWRLFKACPKRAGWA